MLGCSNKDINSPKLLSDEEVRRYSDKYLTASAFKDTESMESAIEYMDELIARGGESLMLSIYYDKAKLLYLQGKYDDAVMTINLSNIKLYEVHKAALYISIGETQKAEILLAELITFYVDLIKDNKDDSNIINVALLLKTIYVLSDKDIDELINQLTQENLLFKGINRHCY
jgi:tetratricopeptide (TPR) repeat protein